MPIPQRCSRCGLCSTQTSHERGSIFGRKFWCILLNLWVCQMMCQFCNCVHNQLLTCDRHSKSNLPPNLVIAIQSNLIDLTASHQLASDTEDLKHVAFSQLLQSTWYYTAALYTLGGFMLTIAECKVLPQSMLQDVYLIGSTLMFCGSAAVLCIEWKRMWVMSGTCYKEVAWHSML